MRPAPPKPNNPAPQTEYSENKGSVYDRQNPFRAWPAGNAPEGKKRRRGVIAGQSAQSVFHFLCGTGILAARAGSRFRRKLPLSGRAALPLAGLAGSGRGHSIRMLASDALFQTGETSGNGRAGRRRGSREEGDGRSLMELVHLLFWRQVRASFIRLFQ